MIIGLAVGGFAGWHAALVSGRNRIDAALDAKRDAMALTAEAQRRADEAEEKVREIEASTLERAIEAGLVRAPEPAPVSIKRNICGCGHSKAFHRKGIDGTVYQCTQRTSGGYSCRCQHYVEAAA